MIIRCPECGAKIKLPEHETLEELRTSLQKSYKCGKCKATLSNTKEYRRQVLEAFVHKLEKDKEERRKLWRGLSYFFFILAPLQLIPGIIFYFYSGSWKVLIIQVAAMIIVLVTGFGMLAASRKR